MATRQTRKSEISTGTQSIGLLWLRVLMGTGIAYHGYGKLFGGQFVQFIEGVSKMGLPSPEVLAWAAALSEFAGGLLIVVGLATRWAALSIWVTMSVAAFVAHAADPLQVKELALAYWTMAFTLALTGAGSISLDARIAGRRHRE